jgi:flavin-dependent dehydrogenase
MNSQQMLRSSVLIIGGGPAGATCGALLARRGHEVTLLEKDHHPRFHIGESLLPANLPLFEKLGVADQVRAVGMPKLGAEFVSPGDGRCQEFRFADAWNKSLPGAYQVRRSQFDEILIRHAASCGVQVLEGWRANDVQWLPGAGASVQASDEAGHVRRWQTRFLVDASGRDTFLANRLGCKRRNPRHNSAALFAHFSGARHHEGDRAGFITVYWFEHGWFWFIPLLQGASSVGAVVWPHYLKSRRTSVRQFFMQTIAACPPLAERLAGAELLTEVEATGNYSYSASRCYGDSYVMLGDAYAFIDPVFSSGVLLAMNGAFAGAEAVHACLNHPHRGARQLRRFGRVMRHGPREYSWFIYRMTQPMMRELLLAPRNTLRMKEAVLSLLGGDIFEDTPMWASLWAFKLLYCLLCVLSPRRSAAALRRRRLNVQPS